MASSPLFQLCFKPSSDSTCLPCLPVRSVCFAASPGEPGGSALPSPQLEEKENAAERKGKREAGLAAGY